MDKVYKNNKIWVMRVKILFKKWKDADLNQLRKTNKNKNNTLKLFQPKIKKYKKPNSKVLSAIFVLI